MTVLAPRIGHEAASEVFREAARTGVDVVDVVVRRGLLDRGTALRLMAAVAG